MLQTNHLNEEKTANNGLKMKIIAYRGKDDIDVKFENGTTVNHKSYSNFKKGQIKCPGCKSNLHQLAAKKHEGETSIATNGQTMKIVKWRSPYDIDVKFEDGTIVLHKAHAEFKIGQIKNPNYKPHINEISTATNGQAIELIEWRKSNDIDVKFEDGTIVYHKSYKEFQSGRIKNPNYKPYINEISTATNGQIMKLVEWRKWDDVDIIFEDGTKVCHKKYYEFKKGCIKNPNYIKPLHINETNISTCGFEMQVINYNGCNDVDIKFEDGTIVCHCKYSKFSSGEIRYPTLNTRLNGTIKNFDVLKAFKEGKRVYYHCKCQKCGLEDIMTPQDMMKHYEECSKKES